MNKQNSDIGKELLFLLKQQRYLYHQLNILAQKQSSLKESGSPELVLDVIAGRRKLVEKIRQLDQMLSPIKSCWSKVCHRLGAADRLAAQKTVIEIRQIIEYINETAAVESTGIVPLKTGWKFEELFAESGVGQQQ